MGIFSFLFPKKITDEYFGVLKYSTYKHEGIRRHYYKGSILFKPTNTTISITFNTDGGEPKLYQKELFKQIQESYTTLLNKIDVELLGDKYIEDIKEEKIKNIDIKKGYVLQSIGIDEKEGEDFSWDLGYTDKNNEDIIITAYFKNFEADYMDFVNLGTVTGE